ncbi:MAG: ParA family protein [Chloroflexi bacterium]|nr:ParA family protein [Chloroflexota bacterium]
MPIVAVSNQKGGVGKTTTTLNLGAALQAAGKRVLLVDLDPQGNLSVAAGIPDVDGVYPSIGDLLMLAARGKPAKAPSIGGAVVHAPSGLDVIPSNGTLSAAELGLVSAMNRESALRNLLQPIAASYDYVLIDCLPSLGLLAINALRAADGVVIPVQADFLAMQGLAQILETISAVRDQLNPELSIYGVLLTMVDPRTSHAREVVQTVRQGLQGEVNVFDTEVRLAVVLKETARAGRSVLDYDTSSPAADAYRALARELMARVGDAPSTQTQKREAPRPSVVPKPAPDPAPPNDPIPEPEVVLAPEAAPDADMERTGVVPAAAPSPQEEIVRAQNGTAAEPPQPKLVPGGAEPLEFEAFLSGREAWLGSASR